MRALIVIAVFLSLGLQDAAVTTESTVRRAAEIFAEEFYDAGVAMNVSAELKRRLAAGDYASLALGEPLASRLTRDLQELARDRHVTVQIVKRPASPAGALAPREVRNVPTTAGFRRTEILPGNIGLFDLAFFMRPIEHRDAIEAAMKTLQPADALILDMRQNGGGSPDTVALLISYLVDPPERPLFEIRPRRGITTIYSTSAVPAALRNGSRKVYVVTSKQSFSGGEGIGFLLQDIKRAIVIGEPTAGAANAGRGYPINDQFEIVVSNGHLLTSGSHRNWEGTGVAPDVRVPAVDALKAAHLRAVDDLLAAAPAGVKREELTRVRAQLNGQ